MRSFVFVCACLFVFVLRLEWLILSEGSAGIMLSDRLGQVGALPTVPQLALGTFPKLPTECRPPEAPNQIRYSLAG